PDNINLWGSGNGGTYTGSLDSMESPSGGAFFGAEGSSELATRLSQTIDGLVIGQSYELTFDWAAGEIYPYPAFDEADSFMTGWAVSFGDDSVTVMSDEIGSKGFQPWKSEKYTFTAT